MNSDMVFSAAKVIDNRYLLCRLTSSTARCLHFASTNTQSALIDAFAHIIRQASRDETAKNNQPAWHTGKNDAQERLPIRPVPRNKRIAHSPANGWGRCNETIPVSQALFGASPLGRNLQRVRPKLTTERWDSQEIVAPLMSAKLLPKRFDATYGELSGSKDCEVGR